MGCDRWIEALSAIADGEESPVDRRLVDAHLARCASCREFNNRLARLQAPMRVQAARPMPDLSGRILKLHSLADGALRWRLVRGVVALVALEILALSVPALILGQEVATSEHAARHLGAFTAAYGAALLVVAVRPARARTILPVAMTLGLALLITAAVDVVDGRAPLWGEALHLPEVLSVVLIWLLATPARRPPSREESHQPLLRVVDDPSQWALSESENRRTSS